MRARRIAVDYASHSAADGADPRRAVARAGRDVDADRRSDPVLLDGDRRLVDTGELDAEYWYSNLREPVRFAEPSERCWPTAARVFIEVSPHPVLTDGCRRPSATGRRGRRRARCAATTEAGRAGPAARPEAVRRTASPSTGRPCLRRPRARRVGPADLRVPARSATGSRPRRRGAATSAGARAGARGPSAAGRRRGAGRRRRPGAHRPAVAARPIRGWPTTRCSARCCCPAPAFVELALRAADEVGCDRVEELTLRRRWCCPSTAGCALQVVVGAPDDDGRRDRHGLLAARRRRRRRGAVDPPRRAACSTRRPRPRRRRGSTGCLAAGGRGAGGHRRGSTTRSPAAVTATARRSRGCGRCGGAARRSSPRWRCRRTRPDAAAFGLHPALLDAALHALGSSASSTGRRRRRRGCRSPGTASRCTPPGADRAPGRGSRRPPTARSR